jgi:hypothetical protein
MEEVDECPCNCAEFKELLRSGRMGDQSEALPWFGKTSMYDLFELLNMGLIGYLPNTHSDV